MPGDDGSDKTRGGGEPITTLIARAPASRVRSRGLLVVGSGLEAGRVLSIPTAKLCRLGRSDECEFRFDDQGLSRVHSKVVHLNGEFIFTDAGSTNGSYVNEERLTGPRTLRDGDRIQLGPNLNLRFSFADEAEEQALRRVYEAATLDGLTGVANRKHLDERLDAEIASALRQGGDLSLLMLDVDFFKRVNDTFGHQSGDLALKHLTGILVRSTRAEDLVARYGGEEFAVVARGIDLQRGWAFGERLRQLVEALPVPLPDQPLSITVSIGVASLASCAIKDRVSLFAAADARLYLAKQGGRNRVVATG
jgi:diguanylate cyclase (GGDEF)-like protein